MNKESMRFGYNKWAYIEKNGFSHKELDHSGCSKERIEISVVPFWLSHILTLLTNTLSRRRSVLYRWRSSAL